MNQRNTKGQKHGLWESYWSDGQLLRKGTYINGKRHGLWESYHENDELQTREFHL